MALPKMGVSSLQLIKCFISALHRTRYYRVLPPLCDGLGNVPETLHRLVTAQKLLFILSSQQLLPEEDHCVSNSGSGAAGTRGGWRKVLLARKVFLGKSGKEFLCSRHMTSSFQKSVVITILLEPLLRPS